MGFYVSPGVYTRERDISNLIPNLSTTTAALVGYSAKGNVDELVLVTNSQQFIQEYGEPSPGNGFHYSALAYLENGNKLYCYRAQNNALYGGCYIAKTGGTAGSFSSGVTNPIFVEDSNYPDALFYIFGKDPGTWNNDLAVQVSSVDTTEYTFNISIYSKDTDGNYVIVEEYTVSRKEKVDGFGRQLYLEDRINGYSQYIRVADNTSEADTVLPEVQLSNLSLASGSNGTALADPYPEVVTGWGKFENPDDVDVRILINGGYTSVEVQQEMKEIAEDRKDCIAILDIPYDQLANVTNMVTWRTVTQNFNSNYCALYTPWVQIYDSYNDKIVDAPPSGYVASQIAYNDYIADAWYAPAGFNRGVLNVLGLTNVFTQGERDTLYQDQLNPLQTFRGEGNVIWGQKTQQTKASALDRVNVRRLLIVLEKAISTELRYFVFEPNSDITRFRVTAMIEEYLDLLGARGAFQTELGDKGYKVVCDETNNTPAIIDRNELHVDIFIKPSRAAEYIQLQTIITQTGASFEELIARGVMF